VQQRVPRGAGRRGYGVQRRVAERPPGGDHRAGRPPVVRGEPVPPRVPLAPEPRAPAVQGFRAGGVPAERHRPDGAATGRAARRVGREVGRLTAAALLLLLVACSPSTAQARPSPSASPIPSPSAPPCAKPSPLARAPGVASGDPVVLLATGMNVPDDLLYVPDDGSVLVGEHGDGHIARVVAPGKVQRLPQVVPEAEGIAIVGGTTYVADQFNARVVALTDTGMRTVLQLQPVASGENLDGISATTDGAENALVTESGAGRLDLVVTTFVAEVPSGTVQLAPGQGICFDLLRAHGNTEEVKVHRATGALSVTDPLTSSQGEVVPATCPLDACSMTIELQGPSGTEFALVSYRD